MDSNEPEDMPADEFSKKVLELDRLLALIARKTRARREHFSKRKLSPPHFMLLRTLEMKGSMRSSAMADELNVSRGAISNLTERLAQEGLVGRNRSTQDRRVVEVVLTEEGKEFLRAKEQKRIERLSTIFEELPEKDLEELIRITRNIITVLDHRNSS